MYYSIQGGQGGLIFNNFVINVVMIKMIYENLFKLCVKLIVCDEIIKNKMRIFVM